MAATASFASANSYCVERETKLSARRYNKHVAERKRRARINTSLDELKEMILSTMHKNPEDYDKMEKADILDLTVKFLKGVKQQQKQTQQQQQQQRQQQPKPQYYQANAAQVCALPTTGRLIAPAPINPAALYQTGYNHASDQVQRFVNTSDLDDGTAQRLAAHLKSRSMASYPRVKRCEVPSARVCRNITRELSTLSPARRQATTSPVQMHDSSFSPLSGMTTLAVSPVNHRASPAHTPVWRPWEGQASA